jgi:hypothetical protein
MGAACPDYGFGRCDGHHEKGDFRQARGLWKLAFGQHEDRTPTHSYAATREAAIAAFRQELAAGASPVHEKPRPAREADGAFRTWRWEYRSPTRFSLRRLGCRNQDGNVSLAGTYGSC